MTPRFVSITGLALLPIALSAQFLDPNVLKKRNPIDATAPPITATIRASATSELDQIQQVECGNADSGLGISRVWLLAESATNVGGPWKPGDPTYWGGPSDSYRIALDRR